MEFRQHQVSKFHPQHSCTSFQPRLTTVLSLDTSFTDPHHEFSTDSMATAVQGHGGVRRPILSRYEIEDFIAYAKYFHRLDHPTDRAWVVAAVTYHQEKQGKGPPSKTWVRKLLQEHPALIKTAQDLANERLAAYAY